MKEIDAAFGRHQKIAFQLSGGKDSVACLYYLRDYASRFTVYHVDAGDEPPETKTVLDACRAVAGDIVTVKSDARAWIAEHGYPSDIVPTSSTPLGLLLGFGNLKLSDRFTCCFTNVMRPMYERMKADGITLVIRGQKLVDMPTVPFKSGALADGFEFLYPLEDWTDDEVFAYLKEVGAPIHSAYDTLKEGVDCMHCTAWWDKKLVDWLRDEHPEAHAFVAKKHIEIRSAVSMQMNGGPYA